jgi:SAM-dependent methyltransferase
MGPNAVCLGEAALSDAVSRPAGAFHVGTTGRPCRADVVASYDLGVEGYEQLWSPVILPAAAALVPHLGLADHSVVLDVGAGTGALAGAIRAAAPAASVLAVDASAEMLRVAHIQRGVPAVRADAMALPVSAGTVHAVVLAYVLFHLADPLLALKEAARVLRPGGRVGTVTWASEGTERAQLVWNDALAEAGVPSLRTRRFDTGLDTLEGVDGLLRQAGFTPRRVWSELLHRQWDPAAFFALASGSGVNRQRLARIDPAARSALLERLRARLGQLGPEDYTWQGQVICAVAAKAAAPEGRG